MKVFLGIDKNTKTAIFSDLKPAGKLDGYDLFLSKSNEWFCLSPAGRLRKVDIHEYNGKKTIKKIYWS